MISPEWKPDAAPAPYDPPKGDNPYIDQWPL